MDALDLAEAAAEAALLKMALRALLLRVCADDAFVSAVRVEFDGAVAMVEFLSVDGHSIGGMSL